MKRLLMALVLGVLMLVGSAAPALGEDVGIKVDGKSLTFDVSPTVVNGVLMVPVRGVAEALGGQVTWLPDADTARIQSTAAQIDLTVGQSTALVNGRPIKLAAPVVRRDGRALVPAGLLLTLYGDRLQITAPGLIDPTAAALLEKSRASAPANFDFALRQATSIQMPQLSQPVTFGMDLDGWVRGQESLINMAIQAGPTPINTRVAVRNQTNYVRSDGAWHTLPPAAMQQTLATLNALDSWLKVVKEAHLGARRTEQGQTLQDVVVTLDTAALQQLSNQLMSSMLGSMGNVQVALTFERASATITCDLASGQVHSYRTDTAFTVAVTDNGQTTRMQMAMQQFMRIAPSDNPIRWPADLP